MILCVQNLIAHLNLHASFLAHVFRHPFDILWASLTPSLSQRFPMPSSEIVSMTLISFSSLLPACSSLRLWLIHSTKIGLQVHGPSTWALLQRLCFCYLHAVTFLKQSSESLQLRLILLLQCYCCGNSLVYSQPTLLFLLVSFWPVLVWQSPLSYDDSVHSFLWHAYV